MAEAVSAVPRVAIHAQRRFAAPPERVFHAWTEPEALKRWWCPPGWTAADIEVDLRVGGAYRIGMCRGQRQHAGRCLRHVPRRPSA